MKKGFTLIELMVVILIVGILAAVAIPIIEDWINDAKWAEGKAAMEKIAKAIVEYRESVGPEGPKPTSIWKSDHTYTLGFPCDELNTKYFNGSMFSFEVNSMDPLMFKVTAKNPNLTPETYYLDHAGNWYHTE